MDIGFLGGIMQRNRAEQWLDADWSWCDEDTDHFLLARGDDCRLFADRDIAVLIRGHVVDTRARRPRGIEAIADRIRHTYLDRGLLPIEGLEGSFTLAVLDGPNRRVILFRNLIGSGDTFYQSTDAGTTFGSNLAALVDVVDAKPRVNEADLASLFIHRTIPGRNTLFADCHRLMPGEQLEVRNGRATCTLRSTLGEFDDGRAIGRDALERVEEAMGQICADQASEAPTAANLLSGGVDSSFLQVFWNRAVGVIRPRTCCVGVDHPRTLPDLNYALTAADALNTRHTVIPGNDHYAGYLLETIAASGEMPSHVQLGYFLTLGRAMKEQGLSAALTAISADNLFGTSGANTIQNATVLRRLCLTSLLRRAGAAVSGWFRMNRLSSYFHLADRLHDLDYPAHPLNQVSTFTHWPSVAACFGEELHGEMGASRRQLLERYQVPGGLLEHLHAVGLLSSGLTTAALMTTLLNHAGIRLFSPFLDSRMLRLVVNLSPRERFRFRQPKSLLKRSLDRHGHGLLAHREKLGWGQPIFEWLSPGGQLRPLVDKIGDYDFVVPEVLQAAKAKPNWFLFTLLCFDIWHKMFIAQTLPRDNAKPREVVRVA